MTKKLSDYEKERRALARAHRRANRAPFIEMARAARRAVAADYRRDNRQRAKEEARERGI